MTSIINPPVFKKPFAPTKAGIVYVGSLSKGDFWYLEGWWCSSQKKMLVWAVLVGQASFVEL